MAKTPSLPAMWTLGFDAWRMATEAQTVIALRMMGMAGMWTLAPTETTRIVAEKQEAFAAAATDALAAAMRGRPAEQVMQAALRPIGRKTRANARRLGKAYGRQQLGGL